MHKHYDDLFHSDFDPLKTFRIVSQSPKRVSAPMTRSEAYERLAATAAAFVIFEEVESYIFINEEYRWEKLPPSLAWSKYLIRVPHFGEDRVEHDLRARTVNIDLMDIGLDARISLIGKLSSNGVEYHMLDHNTIQLMF